MSKGPETKEFILIVEFVDKGNLRSILSTKFNDILWKDKIVYLLNLTYDLDNLHSLNIVIRISIAEISYKIKVMQYIFQILDYPDKHMNKNPMVKYLEYYRMLLQKS